MITILEKLEKVLRKLGESYLATRKNGNYLSMVLILKSVNTFSILLFHRIEILILGMELFYMHYKKWYIMLLGTEANLLLPFVGKKIV